MEEDGIEEGKEGEQWVKAIISLLMAFLFCAHVYGSSSSSLSSDSHLHIQHVIPEF